MKPVASLSSRLLARKGSAVPSPASHRIALDDPPSLPDTMIGTVGNSEEAVQKSRDVSRAFRVVRGPETRPLVRRPVGSGQRIAMTVRLYHEQHHELHLFSNHLGTSCQEVFVRALEAYIKKSD